MMSACVKWAKEEVEAFNIILARQLSSTEHGSEAWIKCMERAKEHAQMLSEVGLDFRNLVGQEPQAVNGNVTNEPVGLGLS
jgi:exocyst complex component 8